MGYYHPLCHRGGNRVKSQGHSSKFKQLVSGRLRFEFEFLHALYCICACILGLFQHTWGFESCSKSEFPPLSSHLSKLPLQCTYRNVFYFFFCLLVFSRTSSMAHGGSQARGQIGAVAIGLTPQPQPLQIRAMTATYTTAHGNTGSSTH